jgi:hypothetical protein
MIMNDTSNLPNTPHVPGFDPEKAARLRSQALDTFQSKNRLILRMTWAYLVLCLWLAYAIIRLFFASTDTQSWILYGVLFLVMIEATILIRLWYWIANSKLATLREIKLLRMDLALQKGSMETLEEVARVESPLRSFGVSKAEHYAWRAATIVAAALIGFQIGGRGTLGKDSMPWLNNALLDVQGDVLPGESASQSFPFNPGEGKFVLKLRADTRHGTVTFDVLAPDGRQLSTLTGGGKTTADHWNVQATNAGAYMLKVTPHEAGGHWRVQIAQP